MDSESWSESWLQNHEGEEGGQGQYYKSGRRAGRQQEGQRQQHGQQHQHFGAQSKGQGPRMGEQPYDAGIWHQ